MLLKLALLFRPDPVCTNDVSPHCPAARSRDRMENSELNHSMTMMNQNTSKMSHGDALVPCVMPTSSFVFCFLYSWIVLWQESGEAAQAVSAAACKEAESEAAGRFKGKCTATFTSVFNGLSIQVCSALHQPLVHQSMSLRGRHMLCVPSMACTAVFRF